MLEYLLIGVGYALSASLQPGPLQAFFLAKIAQQGWRSTLPAAFAPLISDGPIALVAIVLLGFLPDNFRHILQLGGAVLLFYLAWSSIQSWRKPTPETDQDAQKAPQTILQAALVNLLNPNPYLGWSLVMGPAVLSAWAEKPTLAIGLLVSFYVTMISGSLTLIYLLGQVLKYGPRVKKTLNLISALLLVGLGIYFLYQALIYLIN